MSSPVSRSVRATASTIEPRHGCEVFPEKLSIAASTASTPAREAARMLPPAMPLVSWVWKWIGSPISSFSVLISVNAAEGLSSPAMSLSPRICAPASRSSRPIAT